MSWRTDPRAQLPKELFWKSFSDPFSGMQFEAPVLRASAISPLGRDPDLRSTYRGVSPLHYSVIVAPSGLALEEALLARSAKLLLRDSAALSVLLNETAQRHSGARAAGLDIYQYFNRERSLELVCESYELALLCAPQLKLARHELAGLYLRASWALRECLEQQHAGGAVADELLQRRYSELRGQALARYREAYEQEDLSGLKLGYPGAGYLIGELTRERGEYEEAYRWLARVAQDRATPSELNRLARARLELCQEQRRAGVPADVPPLPPDADGKAASAQAASRPGMRSSGESTRPAGPAQPPARPVELVLTPTTVEREPALSPGQQATIAGGPLELGAEQLPGAEGGKAFTVSFNMPPQLSVETVSLEPGQLEWLEIWAKMRGLDSSAVLRAFIKALQRAGFAPGQLSEFEMEQILSFCLPGPRD